jgi:hypothetical protein
VKDPSSPDEVQRFRKEFRPAFVERISEIMPLFSEANIKELHSTLARGLLPSDAKVEAGQYRIDTRMAGFDTVFPAPELVPAAMQAFVGDSQQLLTNLLLKHAKPSLAYNMDNCEVFPAAAQVSEVSSTLCEFVER